MPDVFLSWSYQQLLSRIDMRETVTSVEERPLDDGLCDFVPVQVVVRSPAVIAFYHAFRANARKRGIPIFLAWVDEVAGMILHGHYQEQMSPLHWDALRAVGEDVASTQSHKVKYLGLGVWAEREMLRVRKVR